MIFSLHLRADSFKSGGVESKNSSSELSDKSSSELMEKGEEKYEVRKRRIKWRKGVTK
jgi:hypothetical protein